MTPAQEVEEPAQAVDEDGKQKPGDQLEVPQSDDGGRLSLQQSGGPGRLPDIPEDHVAVPPPRRSGESFDSARTVRPEDEPDTYPEDFKLAPENELNIPLWDEIHNNHTSWSIVRTQYREFLAELLAVFIQLTLGFCSDTSATLTSTSNANTTAWAWGFATMIGKFTRR